MSGNGTIRPAIKRDARAVALGVERLLAELGGHRPQRAELEEEVRAALEDPAIGVTLVAERDGEGEGEAEIVGVLSVSWQRALHVPGRYATIQDLWVAHEWRSRGVGAELIEALDALCREQGVARIEVGLPRETFDAIAATEAFYARNGFEHLGPRMRRLLT